jgi:hypothetical protein
MLAQRDPEEEQGDPWWSFGYSLWTLFILYGFLMILSPQTDLLAVEWQ